MGHTRLAIVAPDEQAADMPFELNLNRNDARVCLVANGEIYNHAAIYADLAAGGYDLAARLSASDCEAIGHAYLHGGIEYVVTHYH